MSKKHLVLYLISDSSGETVIAVSKATIVQFSEIIIEEKLFLLVRSELQVDSFIAEYIKQPGIVIYTMGHSGIRDYFLEKCKQHSVEAISPLDFIVDFIANKIHVDPSDTAPGKYKLLDKEYYNRIASINFSITHDDGQHMENYANADIALLGVSRTSKSPISLYLGQRGYKVANYPIILGLSLDISNFTRLMKQGRPMFIGLTTSAHYLKKIRTTRLSMLCSSDHQSAQSIAYNYTSELAVQEEITYAYSIFQHLKIPVIDVTNKAIEESAAEIINLYLKKSF
jgi:regulator of PEP synthase PpsR (kinase-PPPase family)